MAAPKSKNQHTREDYVDVCGRMRLRGYTQTMISEAVGISQPMVSYNEKIARKRMIERLKAKQDEYVAEKLAQYEDIRREAWAAYEKSMRDSEKEVEEFATYPDDGSSAAGSEVRIKRITTREGRLPNNQYLNTVMATLQAERELLGLDVEKKQAQTVVNVFNFDMLAKSLSDPVPDPAGDKLRQLELKEGQDEGITIDPPMQDVSNGHPDGQAESAAGDHDLR